MSADAGAPDAPTRAAALAYVDAVNAADGDALTELFGPDAVLHHPTGTYVGLDAIRGFYEGLVFLGQAQLTTGRLLADPTTAVLELSATSPLAEPGRPPQRTVDVFTVDADGRITTLDVYYL